MIEEEMSGEARQECSDNIQSCCPSASEGESCCPSGSDDGGKAWKSVVFILIVVAAGIVLARSIVKKFDSSAEQNQESFATIQPEAKSGAPTVPSDTTEIWGKPFDSLMSLNKVATEIDAALIFLPGEDQDDIESINEQIEAAAKKIRTGGIRISAFKLDKETKDYSMLAGQYSVPCVIAMIKGGGSSGVSGEITEAKLLQAYVIASRPSSACCPSGGPCGPTK